MTRFARFALALLVVLAVSLMVMSGCQGTTKAGTNYKRWPTGAIEARLEGDLTTVHNKALTVLRDQFGFTITRDSRDALNGVVEATTARKDHVSVETSKEAGNITLVKVSAGTFDSSRAENILNSIEDALHEGGK